MSYLREATPATADGSSGAAGADLFVVVRPSAGSLATEGRPLAADGVGVAGAWECRRGRAVCGHRGPSAGESGAMKRAVVDPAPFRAPIAAVSATDQLLLALLVEMRGLRQTWRLP